MKDKKVLIIGSFLILLLLISGKKEGILEYTTCSWYDSYGDSVCELNTGNWKIYQKPGTGDCCASDIQTQSCIDNGYTTLYKNCGEPTPTPISECTQYLYKCSSGRIDYTCEDIGTSEAIALGDWHYLGNCPTTSCDHVQNSQIGFKNLEQMKPLICDFTCADFCDDLNSCTSDSCDANGQCVHTTICEGGTTSTPIDWNKYIPWIIGFVILIVGVKLLKKQ